MKTKEPWAIAQEERKKIQKRKGREKVIQFYAPYEPAIMRNAHTFLKVEKKLPMKQIHRVLDTIAASQVVTKIMTADEIYKYIDELPANWKIVIGPCACRTDTYLEDTVDARDFAAGKVKMFKKTPFEVDVQVAVNAEKFEKLKDYRLIDKQELLEKEKEFQNMGLVSNVYVIENGDAGICHCSSPSCVPFMANEAIGYRSGIIRHGNFIATTDLEKCNGTGTCIDVCHFKARKLETQDNRTYSRIVSHSQCYGCGHCQKVCPNHAIKMVPRAKWPDYVANVE